MKIKSQMIFFSNKTILIHLTQVQKSLTSLAVSTFVTLKVYDVLGNEVATLVSEDKQAGSYEVDFNSYSTSYGILPSGVYFYKLKAGSYSEIKKMILLK